MGEQTIPVLPCRTLEPVLDFYTALGFDVTFRQSSPNPYAVVSRGAVQLHFFGMRRYEPAASYSTCVLRTDDVDALHEAFRAGLKAAYGRVPTRGLPRLGALRTASHGGRQFLMTDPGGNCVRVAQDLGGDQHHRPAPPGAVARALHQAALFADSREDPAAAARVLDRVLDRARDVAGTEPGTEPAGTESAEPAEPVGTEPAESAGTSGAEPADLAAPRPTPLELLRLLVLRADVARRLGDERTATEALARARAVALDGAGRHEARDDLRRLRELEED
ncbi:bleomycin resistance protein [Streptomyces fradiae]|uniref:bleomycin resistance protein n=1 Tax=Streptomyces fradiae TaxID=1906 RepID=UPI002942B54D|nr:VOC family protein [Streptomyces fradiae]WOI59281.1 VOC family protein [Streptomyces fradiae]